MSHPDGDCGAKAYQFISDPEHKENLSGRVRAACVTCRRKKIRCNGEAPCQPCTERGIVCEGMTQRKRPNKTKDRRKPRDAGSPTQAHATPSKPPSTVEDALDGGHSPVFSSPKYAKRPSINLQQLHTFASDSGYSTGKQTTPNESSTGDETQLAKMNTSSAGYSQNDMAAGQVEDMDWMLMSRQNVQDFAASDMPATTQTMSTDVSGQYSGQDRVEWWRDNLGGGENAIHLLSTARLLEAQARSLRRLASEQNVDAAHENRRRTIALPPSAELRDPNTSVPYYSPGAFDDLALISDRTPGTAAGTGLTPFLSDPPSYFDVAFDETKTGPHQNVPIHHYSDRNMTGSHMNKPMDSWSSYPSGRNLQQCSTNPALAGESWGYMDPDATGPSNTSFKMHKTWPG